MSGELSKEILEIVVCPQCKGKVTLEKNKGLKCEACKLLYPIKDNIPVMLVDEAEKI